MAAVLLLVCLVAVAAVYLKLAAGPVSYAGFSERLVGSLAARLGPGWRVLVDEAAVELKGYKPAIRTSGLEIRNPTGVTVVRAPYAIVSLNPLSLVTGDLSPREIELRDLHLRGVIAQDGSLSFSTSNDTPAVSPPALPPGDGSGVVPPTQPVAGERAPSIVSAAATSLLQPLIAPSGLVGALDRAALVDAKLTLVGADGRERAAFDGVDAVFEKVERGDRRFELELRGQRGAWKASGRVGGDKGHATTIEAEGVPVSDLMLLAGLSAAPVTSDIRLSGTLAAAFARNGLAALRGRLRASGGAIERRGMPPIRLDGAAADLVWDEAGRRLDIPSLQVRGDGTDVVLTGGLVADEGGVWRLAAEGRDVVVADLDRARPPFRLGTVDLGASYDGARLTVDRLRLEGEGVDVLASGAFAPGAADEVFASRIEAKGDARRLVRVWPDMVNPELRGYLASRLLGGRVDSLVLRSVFDPQDFRATLASGPTSERSVDFSVTASDVGLVAADGLPPLRGLAVQGHTTGTTSDIRATDGAIEMADGRRLAFSEASYFHGSLGTPGALARIGFRVRGGLDALVSLMRSPLMREAGAPDVDPASVRGSVDLKASMPFAPGPMPSLSHLPIELTGTLTDVLADKLPGRERLEDGHFAVQAEVAGLTVKGEGKLGGSPASFDLRLPRAGGGELLIASSLDEAARARRSLPVAPALSGPVGVKVAIPLGAKPVPRVEADLGRAAIDGLLPGWQKPANRPGRVSFAVQDGGAVTELRDVAVDAGPVQMKGSAVLNAAGGIERADFPVFRLSPGDDMRVQLERSGPGHRLTLRGNNADARPLLRWVGAPQAKGKDGPDAEIDLSLAILSGFNDEAMTGVTAKATTRAGELRSLQFAGRFRGAAVEAGLAKRDAGAPIISVRSGDAGATLRFLDLYRRMSGGRLALEARSADGVQQGEITIDEFGLRGEPALRRIVAQSQQNPPGEDERGSAPVSRQDVDQVLFTRLTAGFRRTGSRLEYTDAVIYGPQVGFNLSGWVDTARDRLDVSGTFVPAFILNNAFSQLPVIGLILGGGRTEGLIAVDFRVAGALSGPSVTVNPLTAVAPGILRKLFGWMMPDGQAPPADAVAADKGQSSRRRTR